MEERNAFDVLVEYPVKRGLEFDTQQDYRRFIFARPDSILNTKFVIFKIGSLFFYAFDSYAAKMSMSDTTTGLYGIANVADEVELKIHRKDFTDLFLRINKKKTGLKYVDDYLTITSNKEISLSLSKEAVSLFLEMAKRFSPFHLVIENDYIHNISELKDKKVIGLETQQWLYKEEDVDLFLRSGEELLEHIKIT